MENIDLTTVAAAINKDNKRLLYSAHKHRFTKIGFDVFKLNNSPVESYWTLEQAEDGKEYLVANYEKSAETSEQHDNSWKALSDKTSSNITLIYRDIPIKRFASSEYRFTEDDIDIFKSALVEKLSKDKEFVGKLIDLLPEEKKSALSGLFPELVS